MGTKLFEEATHWSSKDSKPSLRDYLSLKFTYLLVDNTCLLLYFSSLDLVLSALRAAFLISNPNWVKLLPTAEKVSHYVKYSPWKMHWAVSMGQSCSSEIPMDSFGAGLKWSAHILSDLIGLWGDFWSLIPREGATKIAASAAISSVQGRSQGEKNGCLIRHTI